MHPAIAQAKDDLKTYRNLLDEIAFGQHRALGDVHGNHPVDRTAEYKELLERKIKELTDLVEKDA